MGTKENIFALRDVWWKADKNNAHMDLFATLKFINDNQKHHQTNNLMNYRLYGNANVLGMGLYSYGNTDNGPENRVTLNLCQSVSDTVHAKVLTQQPKSTFLTSGGDWSLQRKAKKLDQFVQGAKYDTDYDDKRSFIGLDSCVWGTGCLKIFPDKAQGKIKVERKIIDNIKIDDVDGMYGRPRSLYDECYLPREVLIEAFPKSKRELLEAEGPKFEASFVPISANYYELYNQIKVVEAFHLPSAPDAKDGRHVICIENKTMLDEPWDYDFFPYAFFRWSPRLMGFYGQGIIEQIRGIQLELNKLLRTYQTAIHLCAIPYWALEMGSKVASSMITNEVGRIMKYSGTKPTLEAPQAVPPDLFQAINWYYQRAYEIVGVSTMSAQGTKPSGLNAAVAMREFNDIQSERFMSLGKRWEKFDIDCSKLYVWSARTLDEEGDFKVKAVNKKFVEEIKWKDVALDDSDYILQIFPTSNLPATPAGKLQTIQEMIQAGMIPPEVGAKLLEFPDLDSYLSIANAPQDDIEYLIEQITENGNYMAPEPFQNLQLGIQMMGSAYLRAKMSNVAEDRLALMRQWISEAGNLLMPPQPPTQPTPPQGPDQSMMGAPQAAPMPQPQSPLVPNVPGIPGIQ